MAADASAPGRPAGLYRALFPLTGAEQTIPAGAVVLFRPDGAGLGTVARPVGTREHRFVFESTTTSVADADWIAQLVPLPPEGFYRCRKALVLAPNASLPDGVLVQLAYGPGGEPVIFPGALAPGPTLRFDGQGLRITDLQLRDLERIDFKLVVPAGRGGPPSGQEPRPPTIPDEWDA